MPFREAMPASEMKPTMLATVSDWPGDHQRGHRADRRHRQCGQHLQGQIDERNSVYSARNMPASDTRLNRPISPRGRLLALELSAVFDEVTARWAAGFDGRQPLLDVGARRRPGRGRPCCTAR